MRDRHCGITGPSHCLLPIFHLVLEPLGYNNHSSSLLSFHSLPLGRTPPEVMPGASRTTVPRCWARWRAAFGPAAGRTRVMTCSRPTPLQGTRRLISSHGTRTTRDTKLFQDAAPIWGSAAAGSARRVAEAASDDAQLPGPVGWERSASIAWSRRRDDRCGGPPIPASADRGYCLRPAAIDQRQ